jgi:diguanylate cyclase (GGDEF)-like protein
MNFTDKMGGDQFSKRDLDVLDSIAPQIAMALDRVSLQERLGEFAQLSVTDPLTGLLNRRYIEERLDEEISRSSRSGEPISFLMLDVDEFKSYNDRFGHPAGDEALRIVGAILQQNLRGADVAVRYGGEEFSVLLPDTNVEEAEAIAERIRSHVERTEFPKRKVTVSIGVASRSSEDGDVAELVLAADKALFRAKESGRNNVQVYDQNLDGGENVH